MGKFINRKLLFHVHVSEIDLENCLLEYDTSSLILKIRWENKVTGFWSNEIIYTYATLEHFDKYRIIFFVAETIGKPLQRLFAYYQTLDEFNNLAIREQVKTIDGHKTLDMVEEK